MAESLIKNLSLSSLIYLSTHSYHFTVFNSPFYFDDNVIIMIHSVEMGFFLQKKKKNV
jgi:hypothetical protein